MSARDDIHAAIKSRDEAQAKLDALRAGTAARNERFYSAHATIEKAQADLRDAAGRQAAGECTDVEVSKARHAFGQAEIADRAVQLEMEGVATKIAAAEELLRSRDRRVAELASAVAVERNAALEAEAAKLARELRAKLIEHRAYARFCADVCRPNEPIRRTDSGTVFQRDLLMSLADPASPDEAVSFSAESFAR